MHNMINIYIYIYHIYIYTIYFTCILYILSGDQMESEGEPVEKFVLRGCYEFIENILNISIFGSQFFVKLFTSTY